MKVKDILKAVNDIAPFDTACSWDNCGLIAGDENQPVTSCYITLDADMYALSEAERLGCNLVITHHPIIFGAVSKITSDMPVFHYIRKGISVISAHTCLDMAKEGVNDALAKVCSLQNPRDCMVEGYPLAKMGEVEKQSAQEFIEKIKKALPSAKCDCIIKGQVNKVMVVGGSGGSCVSDAVRYGCDTLVTGEAKHDAFITADTLGLNLMTFGHFETENIVLKKLSDKISEYLPCYISDREKFIERR